MAKNYFDRYVWLINLNGRHGPHTFDFKQELLRFGPFVEVVEPQWFRDEIAGDVEKMAMRYGVNIECPDKNENAQ